MEHNQRETLFAGTHSNNSNITHRYNVTMSLLELLWRTVKFVLTLH